MMGMIVAVAVAGPDTPPPIIDLFESACLNGQAQLKANEVERVSPERLPREARVLLRTVPVEDVGHVPDYNEPVPTRSMPKLVYRIVARKPTFLILPDSDAVAGYRSTCAVYVEADIYPQAIKAVARIVYGTDAKMKGPEDSDLSFGGGVSGYVVMASRSNGATLLAALKNPDYPNVGKREK